jgi:hypothetical protein
MRWAWDVAFIGEKKNACRILVGKGRKGAAWKT